MAMVYNWLYISIYVCMCVCVCVFVLYVSQRASVCVCWCAFVREFECLCVKLEYFTLLASLFLHTTTPLGAPVSNESPTHSGTQAHSRQAHKLTRSLPSLLPSPLLLLLLLSSSKWPLSDSRSSQLSSTDMSELRTESCQPTHTVVAAVGWIQCRCRCARPARHRERPKSVAILCAFVTSSICWRFCISFRLFPTKTQTSAICVRRRR